MGRHAAIQNSFTDTYIKNLKPKDKQYYQREGRGFAIRVLPSGCKTFLYTYTKDGKQQYFNLGVYPSVTLAQAREKYQVAYSKVQNGIPLFITLEVALEEPKQLSTFLDFSALYVQWSEKNHVPLWTSNIKSCLDNDALPYWGTRSIASITRREVIELLELKEKTAPGRVPALKRALSGVFDYALQRDYINSNPTYNLAKTVTSLSSKPRSRVLNEEELLHVWKHLNSRPTHKVLRCILFTACRPGEVVRMHRSEIQGNVWTIPQERSKKNSSDHIVWLTQTVLDIIGDKQGYIFDVDRNSVSRCVQQTHNFFGIARWTPHDLRRTSRTLLAKLGVPDDVAEAVIAHCKRGVVGTYNVYNYREEKKAALIKLEQELLRILQCVK